MLLTYSPQFTNRNVTIFTSNPHKLVLHITPVSPAPTATIHADSDRITDKVIPAKQIGKVDCSKCRFKCTSITEEQRSAVFDLFYSLESYERQKQFVCSHIEQRDTPTFMNTNDSTPLPKKRNVCRTFYLTADSDRVRVCKRFFLATLDIGEGFVHHAMVNSQNGTFTGSDGRGKHPAHNRTRDSSVEYVKDHIRSFPCVEPHYTFGEAH